MTTPSWETLYPPPRAFHSYGEDEDIPVLDAISARLFAEDFAWQLDYFDKDVMLDSLPPVVQSYLSRLSDDEERAWMEALKLRLQVMLTRVETGHGLEPTCTADEALLFLTYSSLRAALADGWLVDMEVISERDAPLAMEWIEAAYDLAVQDTDVQMLWMPQFDGIEEDVDLREEMGIVYLEPRHWFFTFPNMEDVETEQG